MFKQVLVIFCMFNWFACDAKDKNGEEEVAEAGFISSSAVSSSLKFSVDNCVNPNLGMYAKGETLTMCDGTLGVGTMEVDPATIKYGATVLGVAGTYGAPVPDPDPWDVRYGVTIGSTTGKIKVNCRSLADAAYNKTNGIASAGLDKFDTIDDANNGSNVLPSLNPWADDQYVCGYSTPVEPTWERFAPTLASGSEAIYRDKISGLLWTRGNVTTGFKAWDSVAAGGAEGAIEYCNNLVHGGIAAGGWRVPTQKELDMAHVHGIHDLDDNKAGLTDNLGNTATSFFSSTTESENPGDGLHTNLAEGRSLGNFKTSSRYFICVSQ